MNVPKRAATCQACDNTPKLRLKQFLFWSEFSYSNVQTQEEMRHAEKKTSSPPHPHHPSCLYLLKTHHDMETKALLHSSEGFHCGGRQIRRAWGSQRDNAFTHLNKAKRSQDKNEELEHLFIFSVSPSPGELPLSPAVLFFSPQWWYAWFLLLGIFLGLDFFIHKEINSGLSISVSVLNRLFYQ